MLRYGMRAMVGLSGVILVGGLAISLMISEKWHMWLGMGILLGFAPGVIAMQLGSVTASRWFAERQGLVIGMISGATATGMLVFMPLSAWASEIWGWRVALALPAVGSVICWFLFLWLAYDRPQDADVPLYGETKKRPAPAPYTANFVSISFTALGKGAKSWVFWILAFSFAVCGVSSFGITQSHLVPFCGDIGIPFATAAWMLAVIGVCDLIGTIGSGWLSDRYDNRVLLFIYYGLRGLALIWLVLADIGVPGLTIFAVIYGLDFIATVPPTARLSIMHFGREYGPAVFAWIFAAHHLSAGVMAVGTGISRDLIGSYVPAFMLAGVVCLIAALSFILVRNPPPPEMAPA